MQVLPLDAKRLLEEIFRMISRRMILANSSVNSLGFRTLFLPTIAHLIRAGYHLKQGEHISGISVLATKKTLYLRLEGPIQEWASRNCPRCGSCEDNEAFHRSGVKERAIDVELLPSAIKHCLTSYLGEDCGEIRLGSKSIERFFAHLNGDLPMHHDTARRVHVAIDNMRASLH